MRLIEVPRARGYRRPAEPIVAARDGQRSLKSRDAQQHLGPQPDVPTELALDLTLAKSEARGERADGHPFRTARRLGNDCASSPPRSRRRPAQMTLDVPEGGGRTRPGRRLPAQLVRKVARHTRGDRLERKKDVTEIGGRYGQDRARTPRLQPDADEVDAATRRDDHCVRDLPDDHRDRLRLPEVAAMSPPKRIREVEHDLGAPVRDDWLGHG